MQVVDTKALRGSLNRSAPGLTRQFNTQSWVWLLKTMYSFTTDPKDLLAL